MRLLYNLPKSWVLSLGVSALMLGYLNPAYAAAGNSAEMRHYGIAANALVLGGDVEGTPIIELDQRTFNNARGRVGEKVVIGKVHVKATDLTTEVQIVPSGAVDGIFTTDIAKLPAGNSETDITLFYEAKKIGKNEGKLYFMAGDDVYEQINLKGLAIDPATPPAVKLEPATFREFSTEVGTLVRDTIVANLIGLPSSVNVKMSMQDKPAFSVNPGMLFYSVAKQNLVVTFNPKAAGDYEATLTLTNEFFEPIEIKLKGTATAKEEVKPETEGDELQLSYENPVKLLNEDFSSGVHNKPLSMKGWKNVAAMGTRAWWGYTFPEYDKDNAGEAVAKVTAYDSKVDYGQETECQMLLITPPLDFKEAASKMFTFRVMGKNMMEGMVDQFALCQLSVVDGELWAFPIEGVTMPSSPDENGDWIDYHVDLSGMDLPDVFHLAFLYYGLRGTVSSTMYFVDDVTYGRTDLPLITPDKREVNLNVEPGASSLSEAVNVSGKNLTQPIKLALGGRDKASFELSTKELPVSGGSFLVKFNGKEGQHEAFVKLTSRGAATQYVAFFASAVTGVQTLVTAQDDKVEVFDQAGRKLAEVNGAQVSEALQGLPSATYLVRVTNASGCRSMKIAK